MAATRKKSAVKRVEDSAVTMTELVLPQHTNQLGTVFGGTVMSWIDIAASITAQRHAGRVCVTASVDELHFLRAIREGYIVNIRSFITCVHSSSCEIMVVVGGEDPVSGEKFHTTTALLTFVAIDGNGKPVPMPPIVMATPEAKAFEKSGRQRKKVREKSKKILLAQSRDLVTN
jgi:acyl-CoA hydrolase